MQFDFRDNTQHQEMHTASARITAVAISFVLMFGVAVVAAGCKRHGDGESDIETYLAPLHATVSRIVVFADSSYAVRGFIQGTHTFGAGEPKETTLTAGDRSNTWGHDTFLARYEADGSLRWVKPLYARYEIGEVIALPDGSVAIERTIWGPWAWSVGAPGDPDRFVAQGVQQNAAIIVIDDQGRVSRTMNIERIDRIVPETPSTQSLAIESVSSALSLTTPAIRPRGIVADAHGNIFVWITLLGFGPYSAGLNDFVFAPEEPEATTISPTKPAYEPNNLVLTRWNADGTLDWATLAAYSVSGIWGLDLQIQGDGNIEARGSSFTETVVGPGSPNEQTLGVSPEKTTASFRAVFSANGSLISVERTGVDVPEIVEYKSDATVDGGRSTFGSFAQGAVFGESELNETTPDFLPENAGEERQTYIARYNADDTLAWVKPIGGKLNDWEIGFHHTNNDGSVILGGVFNSAITLDAGKPWATVLTPTKPEDSWETWIARFASDGSLGWTLRAGSTDPLAAGSRPIIASLPNGDFVLGLSFFGEGYFVETATERQTYQRQHDGTDFLIQRIGPNGELR